MHALRAGSYSVAISMSFADYLAAARATQEPLIAHFAHPLPPPAAEGAGYFRQLLRSRGVPFTGVRHGRAFTAAEIAEEAHVSGKCLAKPVWPPPAAALACTHSAEWCSAGWCSACETPGQSP